MRTKATRFVVYAALFTALAVVFKCFLSFPITFLGSFVKDTNLSPVIIMASGIALGPLGGGIVGALTDIIGILIRPMGAYFPLFTVVNALFGIIPALFFIKKKQNGINLTLLKSFLIALLVQVVCTGLNTVILVSFGFISPAYIPVRLIGGAILWPIFSVLLYLVVRYARPVFQFDRQLA